MVDKELNDTLTDMRREIEKTIVREVTTVSTQLSNHMNDAYAHPAVTAKWREGVDRRLGALENWRWMVVGGLAVLSAETVFIATIASGSFKHFFGG